MAEKPYVIKNVVGNAGTRYHRYQAPRTIRCKQFIAGQRVVPGRSIVLTEEMFRRSVKKIRELLHQGAITLTRPDGMVVTTTHTGQYVLTRADGATKMLERGEEFFPREWLDLPSVEPGPEPVVEPEPVMAEPEPEPEPEPQVVEESDVGEMPAEVLTSAAEPESEPAPEQKKSKKRR